MTPGWESGQVPVQRVRKAYEQVADQLRQLIISGQLENGARLPTEAALAAEFGVSRATIREALRILAAHKLIRAQKGTGGGTYITVPDVDHVAEYVRDSINIFADTEGATLTQLLEARAILEIPAARLAAERRDAADIERLMAAIPHSTEELNLSEGSSHTADFHTVLLECSGNKLVYIAAQPLFAYLQQRLSRTPLGTKFHDTIRADHMRIAEAIRTGDADQAEQAMREHLEFLRPYYERAWRQPIRRLK